MATRQKTAEQRTQVENMLRESLRTGVLTPGGYAPSVRGIAQQHGVSSYIAHQALLTLMQEGAFQGAPGRGTLVGRRDHSRLKRCLIVTDDGDMTPREAMMQTGFEDRVAQLGGVTGSMGWEQLVDSYGHLPLSGVFLLTHARCDEAFAPGGLFENVARVRFANKISDHMGLPCDTVSFDDIGGGMQAVQYLVSCGHRTIAFLGLHAACSQTGFLGWSREREEGWRRALKSAGLSYQGLAFGPNTEPLEDDEQMIQIGREASAALVRAIAGGSGPDAVIAANDRAALGFLEALHEAGVPRQEWPAIVGFDNSTQGQKQGLTSLRLPWEEVGRAAADLLWNRSEAGLHSTEQPTKHSQIAMRLIARVTCDSTWADNSQRINASSRVSARAGLENPGEHMTVAV